MPTLNQLISDQRNIADSGENNYSFRIPDIQIAYWNHQIRSKLISQDISKRKDITDSWVQVITCVAIVQVDASECCTITTNCYNLRTELKIPKTIETYGDNLILRVTTPNGNIIAKSNPFKANYNKYNKYTSDKPTWYIKNGYIYITSFDLLETINIYGIFDNPEELSIFTQCGNCFSWEDEYPVSMKMASDITDIVVKTKILPFLQFPQDTSNDSLSQNQIGGKIQ